MPDDESVELVVDGDGCALRAVRSLNGSPAMRLVELPNEAAAADKAWIAVTGASAWLALAEKFQNRGRAEEAYVAADRGIEELGDAYKRELVKDDTKMKLLNAKDQRKRGNLENAASAAARVLQNRINEFHAKASG